MPQRLVNCPVVSLYNRLAALAIGLLDALFDLLDGLFLWQNAADRKEAGLHDRIDTPAHAGCSSHLVRINHIEVQSFIDYYLLHLLCQPLPYIFRLVEAI